MLKISVLNLANYFNNFAKFGTDILFFISVLSFKFIQGRLIPLQVYTGALRLVPLQVNTGASGSLQVYTGASGSPSSLYSGVWSHRTNQS